MIEATDRHRQALRLRLGLHGEHEHSLDQIAEKMGLTRIKARQICNDAMKQLRTGAIKLADCAAR